MIDHERHGGVFVFLALFAAVILLGACGDSNKKSTSPAEAVSINAVTAVGINVCTTCHTVATTDWFTSKHANASDGINSAGSPMLGGNYTPGSCGQCHDPNGDSASIIAAGYIGSVPRPVVGCEACHGPGSLHANSGGAGAISLLSGTYTSTSIGSTMVSGQFIMCTNCHEILDSSGTTTNPNPAHLTTTPTGTRFFITDTHFATPGNWPAPDFKDVADITGYAMDFADEHVCTTCHNPHKPATQNREWAQSAHADKNPINLNSTIPPTGYFSGAWAHYNWSCDGSSTNGCASSLSSSSRKACQRCHTTSGFTAYADALRTGDTQHASDIRNGLVALVAYAPNWKPEMLKCDGCHTDNRGNLRNPGSITANYDFVSSGKTYAQASHSYPDVAGSNVCMTCHVGRETGETIKGLNDSSLLSAGTISFFDFGNQSFINSHYLTAGGQVFTATGYEFTGRPYNNISEYRHDKIGTPATLQLSPSVNTGSNGPCIGCHMSRPNKNGNHLFLPISRSTVTIGEVTGIASEVCFNCHSPSTTLILDLVKEQKAQFTGALEALKDQLALKRGYFFFPASPYFYTTSTYADPKTACTDNVPVKNWQTGGLTINAAIATMPSCTQIMGDGLGTAGTGPNNMGAAFNFNLLEHDPGGYVHNRMYVKRLIYDSLDWLDDGIMNYSVGATLNALDPATYLYKAEAMTYVLPYGVLGIEAERP
jgi:hypothetical protein